MFLQLKQQISRKIRRHEKSVTRQCHFSFVLAQCK